MLAYEVWGSMLWSYMAVDIGAVAVLKAWSIRMYASEMGDRDYAAAVLGWNRAIGQCSTASSWRRHFTVAMPWNFGNRPLASRGPSVREWRAVAGRTGSPARRSRRSRTSRRRARIGERDTWGGRRAPRVGRGPDALQLGGVLDLQVAEPLIVHHEGRPSRPRTTPPSIAPRPEQRADPLDRLFLLVKAIDPEPNGPFRMTTSRDSGWKKEPTSRTFDDVPLRRPEARHARVEVEGPVLAFRLGREPLTVVFGYGSPRRRDPGRLQGGQRREDEPSMYRRSGMWAKTSLSSRPWTRVPSPWGSVAEELSREIFRPS